MLLHSAIDVGTPGVDRFTGMGLLDARAALNANPAFHVTSAISGVAAAKRGKTSGLEVRGTVTADQFDSARLDVGRGDEPDSWRTIDTLKNPITDNVLAFVKARQLSGASQWTVRAVARHRNGSTRESRFLVNVGG